MLTGSLPNDLCKWEVMFLYGSFLNHQILTANCSALASFQISGNYLDGKLIDMQGWAYISILSWAFVNNKFTL